MAVTTYTLVLARGADWSATMTYKIGGVVTAVTNPVAEVRDAPRQSGNLYFRMSTGTMITQTTPGVLEFLIPAATINAVPLDVERGYWDLFGTIGGVKTKLISTSPVEFTESVTVQ